MRLSKNENYQRIWVSRNLSKDHARHETEMRRNTWKKVSPRSAFRHTNA